MSEVDLQLMQKHMGHTNNVHFGWYRQTRATSELSAVAKILIGKIQHCNLTRIRCKWPSIFRHIQERGHGLRHGTRRWVRRGAPRKTTQREIGRKTGRETHRNSPSWTRAGGRKHGKRKHALTTTATATAWEKRGVRKTAILIIFHFASRPYINMFCRRHAFTDIQLAYLKTEFIGMRMRGEHEMRKNLAFRIMEKSEGLFTSTLFPWRKLKDKVYYIIHINCNLLFIMILVLLYEEEKLILNT